MNHERTFEAEGDDGQSDRSTCKEQIAMMKKTIENLMSLEILRKFQMNPSTTEELSKMNSTTEEMTLKLKTIVSQIALPCTDEVEGFTERAYRRLDSARRIMMLKRTMPMMVSRIT